MTDQHPNLPWNFMTHGFLDLSEVPEERGKILDSPQRGKIFPQTMFALKDVWGRERESACIRRYLKGKACTLAENVTLNVHLCACPLLRTSLGGGGLAGTPRRLPRRYEETVRYQSTISTSRTLSHAIEPGFRTTTQKISIGYKGWVLYS